MSIRIALNHKTRYRYTKPVWLSPHVVRLRPAPHCRTPILSYSLKIIPAEHFMNWQQDPYGNLRARLVFPQKSRYFSVEVDLVADMTVINPFDFFLEKYAEESPFEYDRVLRRELSPYLRKRRAGPKLQELIAESRRTDNKIRTNDYLVELNQRIQKCVKYLIRMEPGVQSPEKTLTLGSGSCRDSAWLLVQLARHLGLAARFVSGYLIQLKPDVKSLDGPSGTTVDFTDLHAWTEVYLPGAGWVGFDPTSGLMAGEGHIPLCCTPNPSSAAPITGTLEEDVKSTLHHEMTVTRIVEAPRVTKPYTDDEWQNIDALGSKIERDIKKLDIRLTMGGEPTFVSLDDREGDAWHYAALGGDKKQLGKDMLRRLCGRFAEGGLLMFTQGKWYPGEILPRWA